MPIGRPSKYDGKYVAEMEEYFGIESGTEEKVENSKGQVQVLRTAATFPTLAGFAHKIGVTRDTLRNWADAVDENGGAKHPEFLRTYKDARAHQERILVENGLKGGYQANFAIFTAKNVLGWRDKQELEHSGKDGQPIVVEIVSPEKPKT